MEKLTSVEKDLLLVLIAHHMGQELRAKVMHALPEAYNKWMGSEIMRVSLTTES